MLSADIQYFDLTQSSVTDHSELVEIKELNAVEVIIDFGTIKRST